MAAFSLDSSCRRVGRSVLIGGSPLRIFRLRSAGADIVDAIEDRRRLPANHRQVTDRLLDAGVIHPLLDPLLDPAKTTTSATALDVTVVIPVYGTDPSTTVAACLACGVHSIIVVDDASFVAVTPSTDISGSVSVGLVRHAVNRGPAAARNTGMALVTTPFVAFVDADAEPDPDWLWRLLWMFEDDRLALAAPRVRSRPTASRLGRYEQWRSPLDLGQQPARIRVGSRVSYVPAAALVVRTSAIRSVGGFDEALRYGEDVDLVWRLDAAGFGCRYAPDAGVVHDVRPTLAAWWRQRVSYGSAAAALDRRHPGAVAPTSTSRWSALVWVLVASGRPLAGAGVGLATVGALARKLAGVPAPFVEALRLAGRGNLFSGRLYAAGITRAWWPIAAFAAVVSARARRVLLAAAIAPALYDWMTQRPALDPLTAVTLRLADDISYGTGVWLGMFRERRLGPIVPSFPELTAATWPHRLRTLSLRTLSLRTLSLRTLSLRTLSLRTLSRRTNGSAAT